MKYEEIKHELSLVPNKKTKDYDKYNKSLIKKKADVSDLKKYALKDQEIHRTYFQVSLGLIKEPYEQFKFLEENFDLLNDWWHVDQLLQFLNHDVDFNFVYKKTKEYLKNKNPFVRRFAYVVYLLGFEKDKNNCQKIFKLFKEDDEYFVQMGEAWLLSYMAIYLFEETYQFIANSKLKYNILGKAIQKTCDSFRVPNANKEKIKSLRELVRNN